MERGAWVGSRVKGSARRGACPGLHRGPGRGHRADVRRRVRAVHGLQVHQLRRLRPAPRHVRRAGSQAVHEPADAPADQARRGWPEEGPRRGRRRQSARREQRRRRQPAPATTSVWRTGPRVRRNRRRRSGRDSGCRERRHGRSCGWRGCRGWCRCGRGGSRGRPGRARRGRRGNGRQGHCGGRTEGGERDRTSGGRPRGRRLQRAGPAACVARERARSTPAAEQSAAGGPATDAIGVPSSVFVSKVTASTWRWRGAEAPAASGTEAIGLEQPAEGR